MLRASHGRPVARHNPGSAIIVSRPQSLNQGYPARIVFASGAPSTGRAAMNWSAAKQVVERQQVEALEETTDFVHRLPRRILRAARTPARWRFANSASPSSDGACSVLATIVSDPPGADRRPKLAGKKMVRAVRKAARPLGGEVEIAIPLAGGPRRCRVAQHIKRRCALEAHHPQTALHRRHAHGRGAAHRDAVLARVVRQHFDR